MFIRAGEFFLTILGIIFLVTVFVAYNENPRGTVVGVQQFWSYEEIGPAPDEAQPEDAQEPVETVIDDEQRLSQPNPSQGLYLGFRQ